MLNRQFFVEADVITNKTSQNKIFYLQLLKFVLRYVQQRIEQEWAAYSFKYRLV